ncbi:MAG: hypothetical protein HRT44_10870 [Bdellovibrionales bacterium]|nr:hypothetical protein [Bdellovibrionales bacterium]
MRKYLLIFIIGLATVGLPKSVKPKFRSIESCAREIQFRSLFDRTITAPQQDATNLRDYRTSKRLKVIGDNLYEAI